MISTLNLYSNVKYAQSVVFRNIAGKDPIVFILPDDTYKNDAFNSLLNASSTFRKYFCIVRPSELGKCVYFLLSFDDLSHRRVLFMAPYDHKEDMVDFVKDTNYFVNKYARRSHMNHRKKLRVK